MSKLSIVGIVIIIVLIAIFASTRGHIFGHGLSPNGKVVTETRPVGDFKKLKLKGIFKTIISQDGGPSWVKVKTDQNLQQIVEIENNGDELVISNKKNLHFFSPTEMIVYVNVKEINSIINSSVGHVETEGKIKAQDLYLKNDAIGKTTLQIDVQKLTAELDAVGATVLTGSAAEADLNNSSVGKLEAFDLKTDILTITNKAVGGVEVDAEKEISIDHDGVGSLHYKGAATVKNLKNNGVGKVSKAD